MLGDVSGKAAPAALFAALVSGIMRSAAIQRLPPAQMLGQLNDALQERKLDSQYVTMLFAVWNDEDRCLRVSNSGAVQPIVCRGGESSIIRAEGFPLGMFPEVTYDEFTVSRHNRATPSSSSPTAFWTPRTRRTRCTATSAWPPCSAATASLRRGEIAEAILSDVSRFQDGHDRFDDETIIVLKVR